MCLSETWLLIHLHTSWESVNSHKLRKTSFGAPNKKFVTKDSLDTWLLLALITQIPSTREHLYNAPYIMAVDEILHWEMYQSKSKFYEDQ
jgi:hypothetical protein